MTFQRKIPDAVCARSVCAPTLIGGIGLLLALFVAEPGFCGGMANEQANHGDALPGGESLPAEREPTRWKLLDFTNADRANREITKIRIILPPNDNPVTGCGVAGEKGLDYTTDDPAVLSAMRAFLFFPLRLAAWEGIHGGAGGFPFGEVHVFTTTEDVLIGISQVAFVLANVAPAAEIDFYSWAPDLQNTLYSWGLAKYIDDVLFEQRQLHLPEDFFQALSGEASILSDKSRYRQMRVKMGLTDEEIRKEGDENGTGPIKER